MGFNAIESTHSSREEMNGYCETLAINATYGDNIKKVEIVDLESETQTPTRMKEDILLLSWLLVLLRTEEDGQVCFEWSYGDQVSRDPDEAVNRLSSDEVVPNPQIDVGTVAAAISRYIMTIPAPASGPATLMLSTRSLTQDKVRLQCLISQWRKLTVS